MKLRVACVVAGFLSLVLSMAAQTSGSSPASAVVPPLIQFSNVAADEGGNPMSGVVSITFSLYNGQQGGEPLWTETQNNIPLDPTGHYSVQLGITKPTGVPTTLFTTGEARWLGVQISGQGEQPRVLLLSVPYALEAGDAATIGGLPPTAFVLAAPLPGSAASASATFTGVAASPADAPPAAVTGSGTTNFIPLWTSTSNIGNSVLFQSGTGSTAKVGINSTTPATTLDVKGAGTIRGTLSLPATGTATATAGKNSQPLNLVGSAFNSSTNAAVNQTFQWQAEPASNDTSTPSGTLNLLFGEGTTKPSETGLNIASNGQITFATGQAFPGTGNGTVTSVGSGAGLTGGPITGSGTLSIATGGVSNAMLANPSLTVAAGTDLTGGGSVALGGSTTLNLDTTKVPQLNTANTFTGNQTVNGNVTATNVTATGTASGGVVNATTSFNLGGSPFAFALPGQTVFLGFAGNSTMTGIANTASGAAALLSNTTGSYNTASGVNALFGSITGNYNTASGVDALEGNTTGSSNTASGYEAMVSNTTGSYNTASGYQALAGSFGVGNASSGNSAFGYQALGDQFGTYTTISGDSAFGYQALYSKAGNANSAFGYAALSANQNDNNTAVGFQALLTNTGGTDNTAVGYSTLGSNGTGNLNTASGVDALYSNTTGGENTAVGALAGYSNTTGTDLTCVGFSCTVAAPNLHNATAIGAHAMVSVSNALVLGSVAGVNGATATTRVGIGTTSPTNLLTLGQGAGPSISDGWATYSSRRWKTHIQPLHNALGKVEQLRGVSYDLKDSGKHEIGVIAEEVGAVVPEVVSYEENGKDARGVDYSRLTALLIEATKEQQREFRQEQAELAKALRQIKQQQSLLRAQTSAMRSLETEVRETRETLQKVKAQVAAAQPALVAAR